MLALALSLALFLSWCLLGRALLAAFNVRVGVLRSWLLAPGIGLAVEVVALAIGNQAGIPIDGFARPLAALLAIATFGILIWRRPSVPVLALLPFCAASIVFLVWAGWPAFKFGFNWMAFVNDDFTNYCLSAERFRRYAFFRVPQWPELEGTDYTQFYWFMHVITMLRFGAEHALAFAGSLTGMRSLRLFMPLILAFGMVQIFALGALVLHVGRWRRHAQLAVALLAFSPMFILGVLQQLIAQVGGLALMLTLLALMTAPMRGRSRIRLAAYAVPTVLLGAALAMFYPEVTPFAALGYVLFAAIEWWRSRRFPGARVVLLEYTLVGIVLCLRFNFVSYLYTFGNQLFSGLRKEDLSVSLFPFFLLPTGISSLFGFQPMNAVLAEPFSSIYIALGLVLLALVGLFALWRMKAPFPYACLFVVQLGLGAVLFRGGNDFGLFKLAMYMQPAMMATLAGAVLMFRQRWAVVLAAGALVGLTLSTGHFYTGATARSAANGMVEMQRASETLSRIPLPPAGAYWASTIDNVVAAKIAVNFYRGTDVRFLSRDFFPIRTYGVTLQWPLIHWFPDPKIFPLGEGMAQRVHADRYAEHELFGTEFSSPYLNQAPAAYLGLPYGLSLFNKFQGAGADRDQLFTLVPAGEAHNLLVFVHSSLGNHYYLGERKKISFMQQEADLFLPGGAANGIGRFFLFRIEHPSPQVYMRIAASKTLMGPENKTWSSTAALLGTERLPLRLVGSGAINRIVGPVSPAWIDGAAYVGIDFGQTAAPFPIRRSGLAALYNRNIPLDYRQLVAFGRDISALSPADYQGIERPRSVSHFPQDLVSATGLEFSGIYEDGWLSPAVDLVLGAARPGEVVRLRGFVPQMDAANRAPRLLTATINGGTPIVLPAPDGPFDWLLPVGVTEAVTRVGLRFPSSVRFGPGDDRSVAARLKSLEIVPVPAPIGFSGTSIPRIPAKGVDLDGWAGRTVDLVVPLTAAATTVTLKLEYPGWPGIPSEGKVAILGLGGEAQNRVLKPGTNVLTFPIASGQRELRLRLEPGTLFHLPAPDQRKSGFRMVSISSEPSVGPPAEDTRPAAN